jgi:hypothetical protein
MAEAVVAAAAEERLSLAFGLAFDDLYRRDGLLRLDRHWLDALHAQDPELAGRFVAAREAPDALDPKAEAALLIELAPALEAFVARLFSIEE